MRVLHSVVLGLAGLALGCDDPGAWADTCRMAREELESVDPDDEECNASVTTCTYEDFEVTQPGCENSARAVLYEQICQAWILDSQVTVEAGTTCETMPASG